MSNTYYGEFGGQYVSEALMNTLAELEIAFQEAIKDPKFMQDYNYYLKEYVGRETPLYLAERLTEKYGTKIYLKREDLNHTGAHKINNVIGQILLAKRMGKTKVIAETGAGQHGVATATGAALFHMECTVYMGAEDIEKTAFECNENGNAWGKGSECALRKQYIKRRNQRSNQNVGKDSRRYFLCHWFCCWSLSISEDGKRISKSNQCRNEKTVPGKGRQASGCCYGMCWWWI